MPPLKALLALAATATATLQTIMSSTQIQEMADAGLLTGEVVLKCSSNVTDQQECLDFADEVGNAMGAEKAMANFVFPQDAYCPRPLCGFV